MFPITVVNSVDTSKLDCPCGGWLDHHTNYCDRPAVTCSVLGCYENATDGAHVQQTLGLTGLSTGGIASFTLKIVPMCHSHNLTAGELSLKPETVLAPAFDRSRCGRKGFAAGLAGALRAGGQSFESPNTLLKLNDAAPTVTGIINRELRNK